MAKAIKYPFEKVTARAIIVRRDDGCLFGVLHRLNGKFSSPGGAVEEGEGPEEALLRELEEEKIRLIGFDANWRDHLAVDYYHERKTLNLWYVFIADDVQVGDSDEILDARWLDQTQDVWYPNMREKILLTLKNYFPDLLKVDISVLQSW